MASTNPAAHKSNGPAPSTAKPNPKSYYGSLFDADNRPTRVLNALLRAIGQYIVDNVNDRTVKHITPQKLGGFYKPFPGDIDKFLLEAPARDLSDMWAVMGYDHYLIQPNNDRHARPSVPALTLDGFVRWQGVQLLVDPTENVPVLQYAVKHWALRNQDTGETFPAELPSVCCPSEPDRKTVEWEDRCGEELRKQQSQHSRRPSYSEPYTQQKSPPKSQPPPPPHPKVSPPTPEPVVPRYSDSSRRYHGAYMHATPSGAPTRGRSGTDPEPLYKGASRPVPFSHVPTGSRGYSRLSPDRERTPYIDPRLATNRHHRAHVRDVSPDGSRRRSFTDYQGRDPADPRGYNTPHSVSDPHLKSSHNTAPLPPQSASAPPLSGSAPPSRKSNGRDNIHVESESESVPTDSEGSYDGSSDESPGGTTRPPRRQLPRSRQTARAGHAGGASVQESVNKVFRDRGHNIDGPLVSSGPMVSPRPRPVGPDRSGSGDPRRRTQGLAKLPIIGDFVSNFVNRNDRSRRPHSHESRYHSKPGRRSYSDEDYSSENNSGQGRRQRDSRRRAEHEASLKEQDRANIEREIRHEYHRDMDDRSGRHLQRPEDRKRRTSSHADADRLRGRDLPLYERERDMRERDRDRNRDRDRDRDQQRYGPSKGRGSSPGKRRYTAADVRYQERLV